MASNSVPATLPPTFAGEDSQRAALIHHVGTILERAENDDDEVDFEFLVKVAFLLILTYESLTHYISKTGRW